jgi:uncharacterized protein YcbX
VPFVSRISIAPVKGLGLLHPDSVALEQTGVPENRRFHIVDEDGRRFNGLRDGALVRIRPSYDAETEQLTLEFPDGTVADGRVAHGEPIETDFYGRNVEGNLVAGPWSDALTRWAGRPLRLVRSEPGAAVDRSRGQVSLISDASLAELGRQGSQPGPVDGRRFRMLFELTGCEPHEEDGWTGRRVRIGDAVVSIRGDVGRCAITTQNPQTGEVDFDTLRTISRYRPMTRNEAGTRHIPFGVYGEVAEPGLVSVGDVAEVL